MEHFIYRSELTQSYWCIDARSYVENSIQVSLWEASVFSMLTFAKLTDNYDFELLKKDVDKIIEDYRLKNDDKTDTWLLAV